MTLSSVTFLSFLYVITGIIQCTQSLTLQQQEYFDKALSALHIRTSTIAPAPIEGPTVIDIALSSPDFSILVTALSTANLIDTLSKQGPFTVFAPNNDAFIALINELGITINELLAIPSLAQILLYHVIGDNLLKNDLINLNQQSIVTLNTQTVKIQTSYTENIALIDQQGALSNVIIFDLEATNGVVHAIDNVLLPLFDTVVDIAQSFDAFSLLVAALNNAQLIDTLKGDGPFTVFAPTNDAFNALTAALGINFYQLLDVPSLSDILLYHVIGDFLTNADLLSMNGIKIKTLKPDNQRVTVDVNDNNAAVALIDAQSGSANIGLSDVKAKNGIVHVIDSVLLPLFDTVVDIAASFEQFSILVKAVNSAKLTQTLTGHGPFTVFAPNNNAFDILLTALDITIDDLLSIPSLKDILLYHVIGDYSLTEDLVSPNIGEKKSFVTLKSDGQTLAVAQNNNSQINVFDQQQSLTGIASIYLPNVQAKNGVAHAIDRVLLPLFETVVEIAESFKKFSILVKAVDVAKLTQTLSGYGPFTVMAPTNDAFDILLKALDITLDDLLAIPSLADILLYHVVGDFLFTSDLVKMSNISTLTPDGQTFTVSENNESEINVLDNQNALTGIATITLGNVQAKNGIAHVIDRVLLPLFQSIWQIAESFDKFTLLVKAIDVAKLTETLEGEGPFTVFAPTNDAFGALIKFLSPLHVTFEDILRIPTLRNIILYHVIGDFLLASDLRKQQHFHTLTPDAQTINVVSRETDLSIIDQQNSLTGIARVTLADVKAKNGVAHVIDRVLLPLFPTVVAIAESFDKFSILIRAVYSRGLEKFLSGYGPFTVFAPTDDAFFQLFSEINIDLHDLLNIPSLNEILLYHVLNAYVESADLVYEKSMPTINGQSVKAVNDGKVLSLIDAHHDESFIILKDVKAKNGIAHAIDRVLIPLFDSLAAIGYSFKDYSIVMRAFEIADAIDFPLLAPGPFTGFAPTNEAMLILMDQLRLSFDQLYALPMLRRILYGHLIPGRFLAQDFITGGYESLNGYKNFINVDHLEKTYGFIVNGMNVVDTQDHLAHVIFGNVEAFNGVVHVIDRVLVMRFESIMEVAEAIDDYSILVKLIYAAGLDDLLRFYDDRLGPITAFAPNNAAFHRLMFELKITFYDLINMPKLRDILYYHLVNARLLSIDFEKYKGGNELITMFGQPFYLNTDKYAKDIGINDGFDVRNVHIIDAHDDDSFTLLGNVQTNNGVVHVIDRVLVPRFESVVEIGSQFEEYTILIDLLHHADGGPNHVSLYEFLDDQNEGPFTVFVPNNEAFEELMREIHVELVDLENMPNLRDVILYHVTNGYWRAEDFEEAIGDDPELLITQMNGQILRIYTDGIIPIGFEVTDIHCIDQQHNSDDTILGNAETFNGVAHKIDHVILLLFESVVDIAESFPRYYSILVELLIAADLYNYFSNPNIDEVTVFAPNNEAFERLMSELRVNLNDLKRMPNLKDVIFYHVTRGHWLTRESPNMDQPYQWFADEQDLLMLNGQTLYVNTENAFYDGAMDKGYDTQGLFFIDQQHDLSNELVSNIESKNGVVHVVDRVLILLFESVVQIGESFDDYSILVKLVKAANLYSTLADVNGGPFTVFAPNNDAFYKLMEELRINLNDLLNLPILREVLLYHIIDGYVLSTDLKTQSYKTMNGQNIYIDTSNYNGYDGFGISGISVRDNQDKIGYTLLGNVEAKNGVVHVIDRVLIPTFDTVVDIATSFDDYSILVQLVNKTGLIPTLSGPGPFTVFAPNNEAMNRLMYELRIDIDDLLAIPSLKDILLYHTLSSYLKTTEMKTTEYETINGQTIEINVDDYDGSGKRSLDDVWNYGTYDEYMSNEVIRTGKDANSETNPNDIGSGSSKGSNVISGNGGRFGGAFGLRRRRRLMEKHKETTMKEAEVVHNGYHDGFDIHGIYIVDQQHFSSNMLIGNVMAKNGIVHVIDRVLIPLFESIVQIATSLVIFVQKYIFIHIALMSVVHFDKMCIVGFP